MIIDTTKPASEQQKNFVKTVADIAIPVALATIPVVGPAVSVTYVLGNTAYVEYNNWTDPNKTTLQKSVDSLANIGGTLGGGQAGKAIGKKLGKNVVKKLGASAAGSVIGEGIETGTKKVAEIGIEKIEEAVKKKAKTTKSSGSATQ